MHTENASRTEYAEALRLNDGEHEVTTPIVPHEIPTRWRPTP